MREKLPIRTAGLRMCSKKIVQRYRITLHGQNGFPPVNRNEPMTKAAYRRTLNRNFEKLIELDVFNERSLFWRWLFVRSSTTLMKKSATDSKCLPTRYGSIKRLDNSYIGAVRFIEVQEKGFFQHSRNSLLFNTADIRWRGKTFTVCGAGDLIKVKKSLWF